MPNDLPDPITREEIYLNAIAQNGTGGGGGSSTLAGLTDVDLSSPTDGQTLVYDSSSSKWVNGSGGGGLPTPTAADVGAGLTVQAVPTPGAVVVPEQTAAWSDDADGFLLTNVNASLFTVGATVLVTVNGEGGVATVVDEDGFLAAEPDVAANCGIYYDSELDVFTAWPVNSDPFPETVTASCNLVVNSYQWAVDPYAGYDVVIRLDRQLEHAEMTDFDLHLLKGTYEKCCDKMQAQQPITALVYANTNNDPILCNYTYLVSLNAYQNYGDYVQLTVHYGVSTTKSIYLTESGLSLVAPE